MKVSSFKPMILSIVAVVVMAGMFEPAFAISTGTYRIAAFISLNIKPYFDAVYALKKSLSEDPVIEVETISFEQYRDKPVESLNGYFQTDAFDLYLGVGPEATRHIWMHAPENKPKLYCMVLNPEEILPEKHVPCGISLRIPIDKQIEIIHNVIHRIKRIGILYNPDHNQYIEMLREKGHKGFKSNIVPMKVNSKKQIPGVLKNYEQKIDGILLVPDQTVISESLVQYIIKHGISSNIPVIGYNRFFHESGAAMSFILSYEGIGIQSAQQVRSLISGEPCRRMDPLFDTWINSRVAETLGLDIVEDKRFKVTIGP